MYIRKSEMDLDAVNSTTIMTAKRLLRLHLKCVYQVMQARVF
jgi:hypothetical protein